MLPVPAVPEVSADVSVPNKEVATVARFETEQLKASQSQMKAGLSATVSLQLLQEHALHKEAHALLGLRLHFQTTQPEANSLQLLTRSAQLTAASTRAAIQCSSAGSLLQGVRKPRPRPTQVSCQQAKSMPAGHRSKA